VNTSETLRVNHEQLKSLKQLVSAGENITTEFKRKISHPDKVVKEIIAFANTNGGVLLVGVNDDKILSGLKYPEEEWHVVKKALKQFCKPGLFVMHTIIPLSDKKFVLQLDISKSEKRPHLFKADKNQLECYVRYEDKCVKASREMQEIIRKSKQKRDIQFTYGDAERTLMQYFVQNQYITLDQFQKITKLNRFVASRKLVTLVLADVLKITPTEKGDLYSRI
jgi:predicted HTH transcriptional regulator